MEPKLKFENLLLSLQECGYGWLAQIISDQCKNEKQASRENIYTSKNFSLGILESYLIYFENYIPNHRKDKKYLKRISEYIINLKESINKLI